MSRGDLLPAFAIALSLHGLIIGLTVFAWASEPELKRVPKVPAHVQAVVVEKPPKAVRPAAKPKPKAKAKPPQAKPKPKAKPKPQPELEPQPKPEPKPAPAPEVKPDFKVPALDELLQDETAELARQQEAERQAASQLAEEERQVASHSAVIRAELSRRWIMPATARQKDSLSAHVRIRLLPGGEVLDVTLVKSSGDRAFDDSALNAVRSAGRLPVPSGTLFNRFRDFVVDFNPQMKGQ